MFVLKPFVRIVVFLVFIISFSAIYVYKAYGPCRTIVGLEKLGHIGGKVIEDLSVRAIYYCLQEFSLCNVKFYYGSSVWAIVERTFYDVDIYGSRCFSDGEYLIFIYDDKGEYIGMNRVNDEILSPLSPCGGAMGL